MRACFIYRRELIVSVCEISQRCQVVMQRHVRHGWHGGQRGRVEVPVVREIVETWTGR
jgi:hypothetical protein